MSPMSTDTPTHHRYFFEELLDETPPSWRKGPHPQDWYDKRSVYGSHVAWNKGPLWIHSFMSAQLDSDPRTAVPRSQWPSAHAVMAAVDDWIDEQANG